MKLKEIVSKIQIDFRKLTEYALNKDNPKGYHKAFMFEQHLGFNLENYQILLEQIEAKILDSDVQFQFEDEHGKRYQIDIDIQGVLPQQQEIVRTGWIIKPNSDTARLVTLYVRKKQ